jgi:hypothetical protein
MRAAPTTPPAGPDSMMFIGLLGRRFRCHQAAVRLHQQQARRHVGAVEPSRRQRPQVARDDRHDVGVDDRGRGALVLLDLGQDLERDGDRAGPAPCAARCRRSSARAPGWRRSCSRQTAIASTPRPAGRRRRRARHRPRRAACSTAPLGGDALVHHLEAPARGPAAPASPSDVVEARHAQRRISSTSRKPLVVMQAGAGADLLQDRVRGDGGAVDDLGHPGGIEAGLGQHGVDAGDDALARIARRRGGLVEDDAAVGQCEHDVGEGAADVDADAGVRDCRCLVWRHGPRPALRIDRPVSQAHMLTP